MAWASTEIDLSDFIGLSNKGNSKRVGANSKKFEGVAQTMETKSPLAAKLASNGLLSFKDGLAQTRRHKCLRRAMHASSDQVHGRMYTNEQQNHVLSTDSKVAVISQKSGS